MCVRERERDERERERTRQRQRDGARARKNEVEGNSVRGSLPDLYDYVITEAARRESQSQSPPIEEHTERQN